MRIPESEYRRRFHESKEHGGREFPFNIYPCTIPLDFPGVQVHWHDEMEIISVKRGRGVVTVDKEAIPVAAGEAVVVFPGQLHGIGLGEKEGLEERAGDGKQHSLGEGERAGWMEYENIIFQPQMLMASAPDLCSMEFLLPMAENAAGPVHMRPGVAGWEEFLRAVEQLDRLCGERPYGWQMGVKGALFLLLEAVVQVWKPGKARRPEKSRERMKELLDYVGEHFGERITVEDAAGLCCYSSSHFMKYFKQYMGMPFVEYLNGYRLFQAGGMLLDTGEPVTEVAERCGFENLSYFNRLFKRRYGCTPGEYRRRKAERGGEAGTEKKFGEGTEVMSGERTGAMSGEGTEKIAGEKKE